MVRRHGRPGAPLTQAPAVEELLAAHPGRCAPGQAREWIAHRRRQLVDRCGGIPDLALPVGGGCALPVAQQGLILQVSAARSAISPSRSESVSRVGAFSR